MPRQPFPGLITAVEPQAKTRRRLGQRVNVFINERFSFALDATLAAQRDVRPGRIINAGTLSNLLREDGDARAYARALHFIGYRSRSSKEIRDRLKHDEWPDEVIERTVERLGHEGLLNDAEFAAAWVNSRTLSRPRGQRALRHELRQKGVARETIEAALPDNEQEIANAVQAAQSKRRRWENLEPRERRAKLIEFLQRHGFNYGTAKAAVKQLEEDI